MKAARAFRAAVLLAQIVAFLLALWAAPRLGWLWGAPFPDVQRPVWEQSGWFGLLGSHLLLSFGALAVAGALGIGAGVLATRGRGRWRPPLDAVFALAQSVPPIAAMASVHSSDGRPFVRHAAKYSGRKTAIDSSVGPSMRDNGPRQPLDSPNHDSTIGRNKNTR